jgi:hypothetical protein
VVSASLAPRRLIIPPPRVDSREVIVTAMPYFLRDPAAPPATVPPVPVSPPLLSFDGASFMTDFLATAGDGSKLPALLAWRDWAEPPTAMLTVAGAPMYPASIRRATPLAIEPEQEPAGTLDADGVPHGDPAWLRKLYLPLHLRFTFVAFDLMCLRSGWPRIAGARVTAAGAVVRRLVRDPTKERWQDWISADGKHGLWFELKGGLPADPAAIPTAAWDGQDAVLRARLSLQATAALPTALDSARLSLLPGTVAGAASNTTPYGYVPVFSAAEQVPDEPEGTTAAAIAAALAADTTAQLTAGWDGAASLRSSIQDALSTQLSLTVLPAAPTATQVANARSNLATAAGVTGAQIDTALLASTAGGGGVQWVGVVVDVFKDAATYLMPAANTPGDTGGAASFWASVPRPASWANSDSQIQATFTSDTSDWVVLVLDRLTQAAQSVLLPTGAPSTDAGLLAVAQALLAVNLLRVRAFRMGLLSNLHHQMFGGDDTAELTAINPQVAGVPPVTYQIPAATTGGMSLEIEAAYGLDSVGSPPDAIPTWSPLDRTQPPNADAVHGASLTLENLYTPIDDAGAAGGSAYETNLSNSINSPIAPALAMLFGLTDDPVLRLRTLGLDLLEQPARGLLVFPGPTPTDAGFASMISLVASSYTSNVASAVTESRSRAKVHRLRYDHGSIYAIWCWARIAGRSDCENDRVVWTARSEPFSIAEPTDVLGAKPATIQLPDLPKLIRDIPRIAKARAQPFAAFNTPANSGFNVGAEPKNTSRAWGIGWICSFAIPVLTICAFIMFSFIFAILIILPGFAWMLLLKFCIPIPVPK